MSERSSGYVSPYVDRGPCQVEGCPHNARYAAVALRTCAWHWRHYLVARVVERKYTRLLIDASERLALVAEMQRLRAASSEDVLAQLRSFGDGLIKPIDDVDYRSVEEMIRSTQE